MDEPIANSSRLVLPTTIAPASRQPGHDGGVVGRHPVLEDLRRARRRDAPGAHVVLERDRHAGERARVVSDGDQLVDLGRACSRASSASTRLKAWISPSRASIAARCCSRTSIALVVGRSATAAAMVAAVGGQVAHVSRPSRRSAGPGTGRLRRAARRRALRRGRGISPTTSSRITLTSGVGLFIGSTSSRSSASMSAKWSSMAPSSSVAAASSSSVSDEPGQRGDFAHVGWVIRSDTAVTLTVEPAVTGCDITSGGGCTSALGNDGEMTPRETFTSIAGPTGDIGAAFYFHPSTVAAWQGSSASAASCSTSSGAVARSATCHRRSSRPRSGTSTPTRSPPPGTSTARSCRPPVAAQALLGRVRSIGATNSSPASRVSRRTSRRPTS